MCERAKITAKEPNIKRDNSISPIQKTGFSHSTNSVFDYILLIQKTIGNQATQRLLKSGVIQTKLRIGQPGYKYGREGDLVPDTIMRMANQKFQQQPKAEVQNIEVSTDWKKVTAQSRKSFRDYNSNLGEYFGVYACGGRCTTGQDQTKQLEQKKAPLQIKRAQESGDVASVAPRIINEVLHTQGRPLDEPTRMFMEPLFGHDFSRVRVHTDAKSAESTHSVNALAYTVGQDIVFRSGAFRPETTTGRRLLAHELAHVCQQDRLASRPLIQRYEGPEHQDIGDRYLSELLTFLQTEEGSRWALELGFNRDDLVAQIRRDPMQRGAMIRLGPRLNPETGTFENVELSPGEIIALMGDFYATVEQLANAPARELRSILDVMEGERAGTVPDAGERFEEITGGRYLALAQRNDTHFARLNRAEWRRLHEEAIAEAQAAGRVQSEERYQHALLIDAAAGHFLTDAYAAGHLFDQSEVLAAITLYLNTHSVLAQNPEMQTYMGIVSFAGRLPQLVLKNIHDRMNREGFEVGNARGMRWRTFGCNYLEVAQETQRVAALAVFLSRQQVLAARNGESPNPGEIEELMPDEDSVQRATQQAIANIPDAVAGVEGLIYQNRSLAPSQFGPVLGAIIESNLATIGHPGREREIVEMVESAHRMGLERPVVAPSFTLFSW